VFTTTICFSTASCRSKRLSAPALSCWPYFQMTEMIKFDKRWLNLSIILIILFRSYYNLDLIREGKILKNCWKYEINSWQVLSSGWEIQSLKWDWPPSTFCFKYTIRVIYNHWRLSNFTPSSSTKRLYSSRMRTWWWNLLIWLTNLSCRKRRLFFSRKWCNCLYNTFESSSKH